MQLNRKLNRLNQKLMLKKAALNYIMHKERPRMRPLLHFVRE